MRTESYRGYQIDCTVTRADIGKPSVKWHCELLLCPPGQRAGRLYEIDLNAWTAAAARDQSVLCAKELIDTELGPEHFLVPAASASPDPTDEETQQRHKRIGRALALFKEQLG